MQFGLEPRFSMSCISTSFLIKAHDSEVKKLIDELRDLRKEFHLNKDKVSLDGGYSTFNVNQNRGHFGGTMTSQHSELSSAVVRAPVNKRRDNSLNYNTRTTMETAGRFKSTKRGTKKKISIDGDSNSVLNPGDYSS